MKNLFKSGLLSIALMVAIFANAQSGSQKTTSTHLPVSKCLQDIYEPNDAIFNATRVQPGVEYTALICQQGDEDWFELNVPANSAAINVMLSDNPGDFDMELYDANHSLVAGSYARGVTNEKITLNAPNPKSYFVRVFGFNNDFRPSATYTFRFFISQNPLAQTTTTVLRTTGGGALGNVSGTSVSKSQTVNPQLAACINDIYEPNDFQLKAAAVSINTEHLGKICDGGDEDWFEFVVPKYTPKAFFHLSDIGVDLDMEVYDANGVFIAGSFVRGETSEKITFINPPAGTYFVKVFGFNNNFDVDNFYTMRCIVSPPPVNQTSIQTLRYTSATPVASDLNIYPNPVVDGRMNVAFGSSGLALVRIRIYDHVGMMVNEISAKSTDGQNVIVVPTANLASGFYMVEIVHGLQRTVKKVTISN